MIESILSELGLTDKEIQVYLEIVKSQAISASGISKKTKLHRPTVYDIIEKLIDRGLITQNITDNKKSFQASDFNRFLSKIKEQQELAHLAIKELENIKSSKKLEYNVEVFEGKDGLKAYFDYIESLLKNNELKDYLVLGSNLESIKQIKFFILSRLKSAVLLAKNTDYRIIWNNNSRDDKFRKLLGVAGKHKFFPKDCQTECTTIVFNEYVALMFNAEKPIIVRILNKKVSDTYRNQFNLFWKLL